MEKKIVSEMKCLWVSSRNFKINPFFSRDALEATKGATKRLLRRNNFNYIPDTNRYWCSFRFPKIALFPEFSAILCGRRRGYFTIVYCFSSMQYTLHLISPKVKRIFSKAVQFFWKVSHDTWEKFIFAWLRSFEE